MDNSLTITIPVKEYRNLVEANFMYDSLIDENEELCNKNAVLASELIKFNINYVNIRKYSLEEVLMIDSNKSGVVNIGLLIKCGIGYHSIKNVITQEWNEWNSK